MKRNLANKLLALLLALVMTVGMLPASALAAETGKGYLSALSFSSISNTSAKYQMTPEFSPTTYEYTVVAPAANAYVCNAYATLAEGAPEGSTITVKYKRADNNEDTSVVLTSEDTSGTNLPYSLHPSSLKASSVEVVVGTEADSVTYKVTFLRTAALKLLSITDQNNNRYTLTPYFKSETYSYEMIVPANAVLTLDPTTTADEATISVNGGDSKTVTPTWNENRRWDMVITVGGEQAAAETTYTITCVQQPSKLEVTKHPNKTVYKAGETFDPEGMELTATYADGGTEKLTAEDCTYSPTTALKLSNKEITFTYCKVTTTLPITCQADFMGSGTEEDPYQLSKPEDFALLSSMSQNGETFSGIYFKMMNDVTLPSEWTPVGTSQSRFGGTIDGDGKLLTVPSGSLSLIGVPRGATVKNLNIYGEKIPGYGLVQGYTTRCTMTVENVTIKSGSHILKSGIYGGYGNERIYIINCTVEDGVVIGDPGDGFWEDSYKKDVPYPFVGTFKYNDMIGSFAGAANGYISGCVSYATVYGNSFVGGIVGMKGQSMRAFVVNNCAFYGDIIATGDFVGGIVGGGYKAGSAPATPCVTIENCYATGNIKGGNYVGGIFGGEGGCAACWANGIGRIRNNYFAGTVSATGEGAYSGGVVGYMKTMNRYNLIYDNYFVETCGAEKGVGYIAAVDDREDDPAGEGADKIAKKIAAADLTNGTLAALLNASKTGRSDYQQGDKYPVFGNEPHVTNITSGGPDAYGLERNPEVRVYADTMYTTLEREEITVYYSDGTSKTVNASEGKLSGVDFSKSGKQLATLLYENYAFVFGVDVIGPSEDKLVAALTVYGDTAHGVDGAQSHTLRDGNLTQWTEKKQYLLDANATVADLLEAAKEDLGFTYETNEEGTAVIKLTYDGVTLTMGGNGSNAGWMYTLNGGFTEQGLKQTLGNSDEIVLFYSDDCVKETDSDTYYAVSVEPAVNGTVTSNTLSAKPGTTVTLTATPDEGYELVRILVNGKELTFSGNRATFVMPEADVTVTAVFEEKVVVPDITVTFTLLGDHLHDDGETEVHTLTDGNLDVWIATDTYTVSSDATVRDVLDKVLTAHHLTYSNPSGNYVESITYQGVTLGEMDNGSKSGWMYTLNDVHSLLGVAEQHLKDGDVIVFHYTDDYTVDTNFAPDTPSTPTDPKPGASSNVEDIYKTTGKYLSETITNPGVSQIGGEWTVLGLARAGYAVPEGYYATYYKNVVAYVKAHINDKEQLHNNRSTDNSRVILALTAAGYDVTNVGGHNLLQGLTDMAYLKRQGINGPIWALIAFDSGNYKIPTALDGADQVTREKLIQIILDRQLPNGGWNLSSTATTADPDMTAMALTALAPYYKTNRAVKEAVDKALEILSAMQNADGGYTSSFSGIGGSAASSSESSAQVIVALTALGIDPHTDTRFVKNGRSVLDALCDYYVTGGGFKHVLNGELNGMATEQGYYALVAYYRFLSGKTRLYDMTDIKESPKTGDGFYAVLFAAVMVISLTGMVVVFQNKKKFQYSKSA